MASNEAAETAPGLELQQGDRSTSVLGPAPAQLEEPVPCKVRFGPIYEDPQSTWRLCTSFLIDLCSA